MRNLLLALNLFVAICTFCVVMNINNNVDEMNDIPSPSIFGDSE